MSLLSETKKLCQYYQIKPLRRRGQNFLISPKIIRQVCRAADLKRNDYVLEIGAGLGILTKEIAGQAKKVIAVEIDKKLVEALKEQLAGYRNVEIVQDDIRQFKIRKFRIKNYKVIANLPFNVTGVVLRQFLSQKHQPELMVLILQKEVVERIMAKPPKMNLLAVAVQFYARAKAMARISKNNFWPRPGVDSAILRISPTNSQIERIKKIGDKAEDKFFKMVRAGFCSPRKYLLNNLNKCGIINKTKGLNIFLEIGFNPKVRAQEISIEDWIKLFQAIDSL